MDDLNPETVPNAKYDTSMKFLASLFECDDKTDQTMFRYSEATIDVQQLRLQVSTMSLQSNIVEIITKFALQSHKSPKPHIPHELGERMGFSLMTQASGSPEESIIDFLLAAFMRSDRELIKSSNSEDSVTITATRNAILTVLLSILSGQFDSVLQQQVATTSFVKRLLDDTISLSFLQSLIEFAADNERAEENYIAGVFNPVLDLLRSAVTVQNFDDNKDEVVQQILRVVSVLLCVKCHNTRPLCKLVVNRADFIPECGDKPQGRNFGLISFLGPFFNYGLQSSARRPNNRVFINCEEEALKNDGTANIEQKQYFSRMSTIRRMLHQMLIPLLSDQASRNRTVRWLAKVVSTNQSRAQTHFDTGAVLSEHFMTNFISVMYMLSEKIELNKIEASYPFIPGSLVDISKETRLKMDENAAVQFASQFEGRHANSENFSTECFFITISAQKLVFPSVINQMNDYIRHVKDLKAKILRLRERVNSSDGHAKTEAERKLKNEEENWKLCSRHLLCLKTFIQDPNLTIIAMSFAEKQLKLIMNSLCPNLNLMGDDNQLPLEPTPLFSAYPEHYVEDLFEFFSLTISNANQQLMERNNDWVAHLTILFSHYSYINNPFLIAKLVRVLTAIQPPLWFNVVNLRMTQNRLLLCMIKFYSDFEDNGDFYEKFNVRGNIQYMLEKMSEDVFYRTKFMDMAKECGSEFIRFVNMVINDSTWCIDESLSGLKSIHDVEKKMANAQDWAQMDQELRNRELGVYEEAKRKVKGWLGTAKGNLSLLLSITDNSPEPFRTAVLGERLAAMLNHNLSQLMGNKCAELKVINASSYGWHPRNFVSQIISIYIGLHVPTFVKYIAYDERTYTPEFFRSALDRLRKNQILSVSNVERFEHLAEDVQREYEMKAELEEEYDDVPEEFKDPIMDAIMIDPVRLPSGHVMDRAVIERHLLSTPNNPFNRAPLTQGELVPESDLKVKIQQWIAQKRSSKK